MNATLFALLGGELVSILVVLFTVAGGVFAFTMGVRARQYEVDLTSKESEVDHLKHLVQELQKLKVENARLRSELEGLK